MTPETDAEWERSREKRINDLFAPEYMMRDLAKKLELERDQLRRQVEVMAERKGGEGMKRIVMVLWIWAMLGVVMAVAYPSDIKVVQMVLWAMLGVVMAGWLTYEPPKNS